MVDSIIADTQKHSPWNVPCLLGEFNCMSQPEAWKYALETYSRSGINWTIWSFRATHGGGDDSWGVYNPVNPGTERPDLQHDSLQTIQEKWSGWGSDALAPNPMVTDAITAALKIASETH